MIDLECPSCGRGGSIPRDKVNTRLVCKKCHKVFHVNSAGRTLLGEPQAEAAMPAGRRTTADGFAMPSFEGVNVATLKETLPTFRLIPTLSVMGALAVVWIAWWFLMLPPPSLEAATKEVATHFADDDMPYLKQITTTDSVDDVVRWFDVIHPGLVKSRDEWKTRNIEVRVMVIDENRKQSIGESQAFLYPGQGVTHSAKVEDAATAANAGGPAMLQPVQLKLFWILERGRWRLNGHETFQASQRAL